MTFLGSLAGFALLAAAQPVQGGSGQDDIVVTGKRESTLDLARLADAQAAFRAGRARFAPTSILYFQLRPGSAVPGTTLRLRKGDETIPVAIDGDGRFSLPDVSGRGWELLHNRGAGRIAVRAIVLSAGASEVDRPLGDLRLQCRVAWQLLKAGQSLLVRGGFDAIGGCASSRFAFYFSVPTPIAAATIAHDGKTRDLPVRSDRGAYRAPLGDRTLPNDARIRVRSG